MKAKFWIIVISISVTALLAADALWLPYRSRKEIFSHDYPERTQTGMTRSYLSFILRTTSDNEYLIPSPLAEYLAHGETIVVGRSFIFNKPSMISWCKNGDCYSMGISVFHNEGFAYPLFAGIIILSILIIVRHKLWTSNKFPYHYLLIALTAMSLILYLFISFN